MGKVYIASMKMRGKWAKHPQNAKIINVTSMQGKQNAFRRDFSPMSPIQNGYKGFYCFQNYWQSGKVYEGIDYLQALKWWKKQTKGKRRYPKTKGIKPLYAKFNEQKQKLGKVESRKKIYVPEYYNLMSKTQSFKNCFQIVKNGQDVVVYDFDGPKTNSGDNDCRQVSLQLLKQKINDERFPFGHGYIVAGALVGIKPEKYI